MRLAVLAIFLLISATQAPAQSCGPWQERAAFIPGTGGGVAWAGDRFILADGNGFLSSTDGWNWTPLGLCENKTRASTIEWTGTEFLASCYSVDGSWPVARSTDGVTWTRGQTPMPHSVLEGSDGVTALALEHAVPPPLGVHWWTTAGWGSVTVPGRPFDVDWNGTEFYLHGRNPSFTGRSTDGVHWTFEVLPEDAALPSVVESIAGRFVAILGGAVVTSTDAKIWTPVPGAPVLDWIARSGDRLYGTMAQEFSDVYASSDGVTWTIAARGVSRGYFASDGTRLLGLARDGFPSNDVDAYILAEPHASGVDAYANTTPRGAADVLWIGDRFVSTFVAFPDHLPLMPLSRNAADWWMLRASGAPAVTSDIAWSGDTLVQIGSSLAGGSTDRAKTWRWTSLVGGLPLRDVVWNGDLFLAVGGACASPADCDSAIATSRDGAAWTYRDSRFDAALPAALLQAVTWDGRRFIAAGSGIWSSTDGMTWTSVASGTFQDVVWNGSRFAAAGQTLVYSDDGTTWMPATTQFDDVTRLLWTGAQFLAGRRGTPALLSSTDGVAWSPDAPPASGDATDCGGVLGLASNGTTTVTTQVRCRAVHRTCTSAVAPLVMSVHPRAGSPAGGMTARITGQAFVSGAAVSFGGVFASNVTVEDSTTLTATVPAGTGIASVEVVNPDGSKGSLPQSFTYRARALRIDAFAPQSGAAGTRISIDGDGFLDVTSVLVGTAQVPFAIVSDARIVAHAPSADGVIRVVTSSASAESAAKFVVTPPVASNGTIIIRNTTTPATEGAFTFTDPLGSAAFNLGSNGTLTFANVPPGTYSFSEISLPGGYIVAGLSCDDEDSTADPFEGTAAIRVHAAETVTCTFHHALTASSDEKFVFHLSGAEQVPRVKTTAGGGCYAEFAGSANVLSLLCVHDVAAPAVVEIRRGSAGTEGPVVFSIGNDASPVSATWSGMTAADVADLLGGKLYITVGDTLRGQIVPRGFSSVLFSAVGQEVVPPSSSTVTADCDASFYRSSAELYVFCNHRTMKVASAHLHRARRGENGPMVAALDTRSGTKVSTRVAVTPRTIADFAGWFLYADLHGATAGDELRGQIAPPLPGTIRISKTAPSGITEAFEFHHKIGGAERTFTLSPGETVTFEDVTPGTYRVSETPVEAFPLKSITCDDSNSAHASTSNGAEIRVEEGEVVTCTFHNEPLLVTPPELFVFAVANADIPDEHGGCHGTFVYDAALLDIVCTHNVPDEGDIIIERTGGGSGSLLYRQQTPMLSPIGATWTRMTAQNVADLRAGNLILSVRVRNSVLSGAIVQRSLDSVSFTADGRQQVPPTKSVARATCFADLADDAMSLLVTCDHTVQAASRMHLHDAPAGENGPIIHTFTAGNPFSGRAALTTKVAADFVGGFLYVDVHSPAAVDGEIRGQLTVVAPSTHEEIPATSLWALFVLLASLTVLAWWRSG